MSDQTNEETVPVSSEDTFLELLLNVSEDGVISTSDYFIVNETGNLALKKVGPKEILNLNPDLFDSDDFESDSSETDEIVTLGEPTEESGLPEYFTLEREKPFGTDIKIFRNIDDDEYYELDGKYWQGSNTPPTDNPIPALAQTLRYLSTDGDDLMAVEDGMSSEGGEGEDQFFITEGGDLTIADFTGNEDKLVFNTGRGLTSKDQIRDAITNLYEDEGNLIVEFGEVATITLVGVTQSDIGWDDVTVLS